MTSSNNVMQESINKINKSELYSDKKPITNPKSASNITEKTKILLISLDEEKSQTLIKINGNESLLEIRNIINKIIEKEPYLLNIVKDDFLFGTKEVPISKVFENDFSIGNLAYKHENNLKLTIFSADFLNASCKKQKGLKENLDSFTDNKNFRPARAYSIISDEESDSPKSAKNVLIESNYKKPKTNNNRNNNSNSAFEEEIKIESSSDCAAVAENRNSSASKENKNFLKNINTKKRKKRNSNAGSNTSDFEEEEEDFEDSSYSGSKNEDIKADFKTKLLNKKRKRNRRGLSSKSDEHYLYDIIPYYLYSKTREELTLLISKYGLNSELKTKPEMKEELFRYFEEQKEILMKNNTWNLKLNDKKMFIYNQYAKLTRYELLQKFKFLFFHMTKLEMLEKVVQVLYRQLRSC